MNNKINVIKKWFVQIFVFSLFLYSGDVPAVFDDLEPGIRARALGGAFVSLADDGTAAFYNPAGLEQIKDYSLYGSHQKLYGQDFLSFIEVNGTVPVSPKYGTAGFGYQSLETKYGGEVMSQEKTITLAHGFNLMRDIHSSLSLGYGINFYFLNFGESVNQVDLGSSFTMGLNFGVYATLRHRTKFGAIAENINSPTVGKTRDYDLPRRVKAGVAYKPFTGITTLFELEKLVDEDVQLNGGLEYQIFKLITLRGGFQSNPSSLCLGFGVNYKWVRFDYAFSDHPVLPVTHYFGAGVSYQGLNK